MFLRVYNSIDWFWFVIVFFFLSRTMMINTIWTRILHWPQVEAIKPLLLSSDAFTLVVHWLAASLSAIYTSSSVPYWISVIKSNVLRLKSRRMVTLEDLFQQITECVRRSCQSCVGVVLLVQEQSAQPRENWHSSPQPARRIQLLKPHFTIYSIFLFLHFCACWWKCTSFSFVDLGSSGLKVLRYLLFTDETNKKKLPWT